MSVQFNLHCAFLFCLCGLTHAQTIFEDISYSFCLDFTFITENGDTLKAVICSYAPNCSCLLYRGPTHICICILYDLVVQPSIFLYSMTHFLWALSSLYCVHTIHSSKFFFDYSPNQTCSHTSCAHSIPRFVQGLKYCMNMKVHCQS